MTSPIRSRARVAAASLVLALAAAGCSEPTADPTPAAGESTAGEETPASPSPATGESSPSEEPTASSDSGTAVPAYFVTDSARGPRLVREFHRVQGDPLTEAARLVMEGGVPADPDYRSLWPGGALASVEASDGLLVVRLQGDAFTEAPDGMPRREARLALQQVVYTLQGVQQARVPVQFVRDAGPARLLGLDVSAPVRQRSPLKVLNHVNITSPEEGAAVTGDTVEVSGVASSFEANVICELVAADEVVATVPFTAEGWMGDRLFPFSGELPLADAGTGDVVVRCSTDDPSGGTEGAGPMSDTKLISVG